MIPRYRASMDLTARTEPVTASGVLAIAREWISAVERSEVPELVPGSCPLPSGAQIVLQQHADGGRQIFALRYDRPVHGAAWRTDLGFEPTAEGGRVFIGISTAASDRVAGRGRGHPPRIARMLISRYAASAGVPLLAAPTPVVQPEDVDTLVAVLGDRSRRVPTGSGCWWRDFRSSAPCSCFTRSRRSRTSFHRRRSRWRSID